MDLTHQLFGCLRVLRLGVPRGRRVYWLCRCEARHHGNVCGMVKEVRADALRAANGTRSCGCLRLERFMAAAVRHGHARRIIRTPEYHSYAFHKNLCRNPKSRGARWFHDRGILFLFATFEDFLAEVGLRPYPDYKMTRIDRNGNFEPGNVHWVKRRRRRK